MTLMKLMKDIGWMMLINGNERYWWSIFMNDINEWR